VNKSTIIITLDDDKATELVAYLMSKGIKGFTVTDTVAGVQSAQAAQAKAETPTPKKESKLSINDQKKAARKPGTSYKADGASVGFLIEKDEKGVLVVVEKRFNADTHRMYNCLAMTHATQLNENGTDGEVLCKQHVIGRDNFETEMRYLQGSLMFPGCSNSKIKESTRDGMIAELEAQAAKTAEREAMIEEAKTKASEPTTPDEYPTKP